MPSTQRELSLRRSVWRSRRGGRRLTVVVIGLILFAAAAAATAILIIQNQGDGLVQVRAVGHSWLWPEHRIVTAGLAVGFIGLVGAAMMRHGAARRRREHAELVAENDRLRTLHDLDVLPFFMDETTDGGPGYGESIAPSPSRPPPAVGRGGSA
jgi:hypothetical protein